MRAFLGICVIVGSSISFFSQEQKTLAEAALRGLPISHRAEIERGLETLMRLEREENWVAQADVIALQTLRLNKVDWIENARHGSFFGRRLERYRIDTSRTDNGVGHILLYGCAKLRGQRRGYQFLIEATQELGGWRFLGLHTMSGLDAPPTRCRI